MEPSPVIQTDTLRARNGREGQSSATSRPRAPESKGQVRPPRSEKEAEDTVHRILKDGPKSECTRLDKRGISMTLSKRSIETLLDLVENKLSCIEVFDREDARELASLEVARRQLQAMLSQPSRVDVVPFQRGRPRSATA